MKAIQHYQSQFVAHLEQYNHSRTPRNLYDPIQYILGLGGKRLRPTLTLMTTDCFGGDVSAALDAALAIEVFHNFSLIHDDIMDNAPLRRGQQTVHEKWDLNTGILSGDAMLIMAYQLFEGYNAKQFQQLTTLFSKTALQVCEGQQYDIDFETRFDVTIPQYIKMIEYKTAVLVGAAMQMGAIVAGASVEDQQKCYAFGKNLGIAFQLQDDYLDAFGDPKTFGKQVGGDILENKKTYLFLKAMELGSKEMKAELKTLYESSTEDLDQKIATTLNLFEQSGATETTKQAIQNYTQAAFDVIETIEIEPNKKQLLRDFGSMLMTRTS
ncbi:MAG: polyprenyl synthetase family protein [Flavobacteriaceae bacterium]